MTALPAGVTLVDHPLIRVKLTRMRDERTTPEEFRRRLSELSTLMVYEITRSITTRPQVVNTPLARYEGAALARPIILAPILRAGLGMLDGMLSVMSDVSVGHIGMRRDEVTHRPESYYFNLPSHLPDADVILLDPMLATGHSATAAISKLKDAGATSIRMACCVSCPEGLEQVKSAHPEIQIFTAAVDECLNDHAYIVPGLGDAGDRYFGTLPRL